MSETLRVSQINPAETREKYFSFQIKGWTNFDPMHKTLAKMAAEIEEGGGFLTVVEVLTVEDNLASIGDEDARECFENILAARRLIQNVHELPKKLIKELRSALETEEEAVPRKTVISVANSPLNHESGSKTTSSPVAHESGSRNRPWP